MGGECLGVCGDDGFGGMFMIMSGLHLMIGTEFGMSYVDSKM